ncbi:16S rRNA pseudouridine516 synthase [Enterococcus sp. DIV0840]|uniref:16S rRNA pseudouridine(516) synthase n=1 Tax=Enterococcus TaxID=1350 RepID=UPI001A8CE0A7|nr:MULTISPECIES: 16S rRNA pseudouridine(516) synthase [Enterococcus]MBO0434566.1 16S rRNA pseudouridine(516) synthase [Enterococcus sp. DIV0849a]MBO0472308.1 16S rRNA pseudouridine(516) synthase [Enterococcus ureasiticus]
MRLDKLLEQEKIGSRRKVKALIRSKQVTVDGQVMMDESLNVDATLQDIIVGDKKIQQQTHVYYMLNKPQGVVTAVKDAQHQTVIDLIRASDQRAGLYPIGRLDRDTEGLLLITDNGQLGYQLLLPHKKVSKRYEVVVNERLTEVDCKAFAEGIVFSDGKQCKPAELRILSSEKNKSHAQLDITEGKFHQVKKMFLSVGKKVIYLKRLSMGPIQLDPGLGLGEYRSLNQQELQALLPYFTIHKKEKSVEHEI